MAKRFTDTEKWKKRFIKGLSTVHKLFFFYLLDDCDHAGIWHVEFDVAEIRTGEKLNIDEIKEKFKKHIIEIDNGEKWFIPYFVEFQYGELNPNVNAHKSVIDKLSKYKLIKKYQGFINCSLTVKDKDKDMDMDKERVKREIKFRDSLTSFVETYGEKTIKDFYDYWREPNRSKSKMRWEQQKTWDLNLRLKKWENNNDSWKK